MCLGFSTRAWMYARRSRGRAWAPWLCAFVWCLALLGLVPGAQAGRHDLRLVNLCQEHSRVFGGMSDGQRECNWIQRDDTGLITGLDAGRVAAAHEAYRSLMSELGVVLAPHIVTPASTIGFAGFQISAELAFTSISNRERYWDGVAGVDPASLDSKRPATALGTVGVFVRKGIWLPLPSMEAGAGFVHLLESQLIAYQGYLKFALHEGFQSWPIPSLAGRLGLSHVTGTGDTRLDVMSLDALASKGFGVMGTLRIEPFFGGSLLYVRAKSGVFDLTPGCDAVALASATAPGDAGPQCTAMQVGTTNDLTQANFRFPNQDLIVRKQVFAGLKVHFAAVHLTAQFGRIFEVNSRDKTDQGQGARDAARDQDRLSLSAGFDF